SPPASDSCQAPLPSIIDSGPEQSGFVGAPGRGRFRNGSLVTVPCAEVVNDCGACDACATTCGPCRGSRIREWAGCCDDPCCLPRPHAWIRGAYLLWNIRGQNVPPLVTGENPTLR